MERADVVIVGSGHGAAVVAKRLTERGVRNIERIMGEDFCPEHREGSAVDFGLEWFRPPRIVSGSFERARDES